MTEMKTRKASVSHNKGLINGFAAFFTYFFGLFSCKEGFLETLGLKESSKNVLFLASHVNFFLKETVHDR